LEDDKRVEDSRKTPRFPAEMSLRSTGLPLLQAQVVDLSATGARVNLRAAAPPNLVRQVIRFGASLPGQQSPFFEGSARVAWVRETPGGWQAGLEWEKLPAQDKCMLESVLELLVP
jgi:hypothetical protein